MISIRRPLNYFDKKYMYKLYADEFGFDKINQFKVQKLYRKEGEKLTRPFLHHLISDWILQNYQETEHFLSKFKKYLRKGQIILNDLEYDQLLTVEERVFSKHRHIKLLLVNISLDKGEQAGAKFTNAYLYQDQQFLAKGNLIFTNKRIIVESTINYSFYYDKVQKIRPVNEGLFIRELHDYLVTIHDSRTLINTFYNHYQKKVGKLV